MSSRLTQNSLSTPVTHTSQPPKVATAQRSPTSPSEASKRYRLEQFFTRFCVIFKCSLFAWLICYVIRLQCAIYVECIFFLLLVRLQLLDAAILCSPCFATLKKSLSQLNQSCLIGHFLFGCPLCVFACVNVVFGWKWVACKKRQFVSLRWMSLSDCDAGI